MRNLTNAYLRRPSFDYLGHVLLGNDFDVRINCQWTRIDLFIANRPRNPNALGMIKEIEENKGRQKGGKSRCEDSNNIQWSGNLSSSEAHRCGIWKEISRRAEERKKFGDSGERGKKDNELLSGAEKEINRLSLWYGRYKSGMLNHGKLNLIIVSS